ncbi:MAG TPA: hypothetical protein VGO93_18910 [Candidatus Xenobia bacterium]|jgi:hypothetical protein
MLSATSLTAGLGKVNPGGPEVGAGGGVNPGGPELGVKGHHGHHHHGGQSPVGSTPQVAGALGKLF